MLSLFYRKTFKKIPGVDHSRIMHLVKQIYHRYHDPPLVPNPPPTEETVRDSIPQRAFQDNCVSPIPTLDSARLSALAWFVSQLGLDVTHQQLLRAFEQQLLSSDWTNLLALLDWAIQNTELSQMQPARGSVVRVTDLKDSGMPQRRRNILFVTGQFPNPIHGGGGRVFDFIKVIGKSHNVYLYTWFVPTEDAIPLELLRPYCAAIDNVPYLEFEHSVERLKKFVAGVPIDIVHYEWLRSLTNFDASLGNTQIFTYMECVSLRLLIDLRLKDPHTQAWIDNAIAVFDALKVELVDAAQVNARVVVTQKDGEFLAHFAPKELFFVLNHGINFDEFCLPEREREEHSLAFVGNFLHYPNEDGIKFFFSEVFDLIKAQVPDVRVFLVGANPTSTVMAYQDGQNIFVTGTVDDFRPYVQKASVCIAPLTTGAGLRSKVIQYAALKRVCVATSVAATDLIFESGKDIFVADDPETFAQDVIYLLEHKEIAREMGGAAFEKARLHYDNRRLVSALYYVYEDIDRDHLKRRNLEYQNIK